MGALGGGGMRYLIKGNEDLFNQWEIVATLLGRLQYVAQNDVIIDESEIGRFATFYMERLGKLQGLFKTTMEHILKVPVGEPGSPEWIKHWKENPGDQEIMLREKGGRE